MAEEDQNEEVLEEEEEDLTPPKKDKPKKCPECPSMAPAWMATFADMATLLMAFFVLILSFTESDKPSINKIESIIDSDFYNHLFNEIFPCNYFNNSGNLFNFIQMG